MEPHSEKWILHIRSKDCVELTPGFNTHLQVKLTQPILRRIGHQLNISISSAEIPFVWYGICSYLKSNQIEVNGASALQIDDGNYDIYEIVDLINASPTFPFSATFNENNYKVTLTNTTTVLVTLNFSSENSKELSKLLGFENTADVNVGVGQTVTSNHAVNIWPVHSIFLHSTLAAVNVFTTEFGGSDNIIDKIPLGEVGPSQIITYDPYESAPFSSVLQEEAIQNFEISLRDQNGRLLQLNDARFEISLFIEQKLNYDHEDDHPVHPYPEKVIKNRRGGNTYISTSSRPSQPITLPNEEEAQETEQAVESTPVKRPRIDEEHLLRQEHQLQEAVMMASELVNQS